jgi:predicted nucleic acid-binding Zn ribbon protein
VWEEAVGSRIARRAVPTHLHAGVLFVRVSSAAWANELSLLAEDIRAQLKARGCEVAALRFRVGEVDTREARPRATGLHKAPPRHTTLPSSIARHTARIDDAELKRALEAAAGRSLWLTRER